MSEQKLNITQQQSIRLEFTGNWFIDAGILGFTNLMEKVYGWSLEELNNKIISESDKVYYGYFPFGYIYDHLLQQLEKIKTPYKEEIKNNMHKIKESFMKTISNNFSSSSDIFNATWKKIDLLAKEIWIERKVAAIDKDVEKFEKKIKELFEEHKKEKYKKLLENLKEIKAKKGKTSKKSIFDVEEQNQVKEKLKDLRQYLSKLWEQKTDDEAKDNFFRIPISNEFFTNFLMFNSSCGYKEQRDGFKDLIDFNINNREILGKLDKTVNKFLPSESDFPNITYTKTSTETLKHRLRYLFVYLLCFTYAFENFEDMEHVFFYSSDLEFSHNINKKLRWYKKKVNLKDSNTIFKVTWKQIIDLLVEYKSSWSLENMYIIKYRKLSNKEQEGIEYIGIPKLQASILLDDHIRENLNHNIQSKSKNFERNTSWLLEEFIKGESLYPIILSHINLVLNKEAKLNYYASLTSLIVEANILNFRFKNIQNKKVALFSENHFDSYKSLINEIKEDVRYSSYSSSIIKQISKDKEIKERIARELLSALKARNKNLFLNILLKNLNERK